MHVSGLACVHICTCGDQRSMLGVFSIAPHHLLCWTGFLRELELINCLDGLTSQLQEFSSPHLSSAGIIGTCCHAWLFKVCDMYVCICAHICACGGQGPMLSLSLCCFPPHLPRPDLSLELRAHKYGWSSWLPRPRYPVFASWVLGLHLGHHICIAFICTAFKCIAFIRGLGA